MDTEVPGNPGAAKRGSRHKQARRYMGFIDIYAQLTANELRRYEQEYPEESATMAGFAERFMQQGERMVLERKLQRRFGPLKPELLRKLE